VAGIGGRDALARVDLGGYGVRDGIRESGHNFILWRPLDARLRELPP
jgi:hypothetical protein